MELTTHGSLVSIRRLSRVISCFSEIISLVSKLEIKPYSKKYVARKLSALHEGISVMGMDNP